MPDHLARQGLADCIPSTIHWCSSAAGLLGTWTETATTAAAYAAGVVAAAAAATCVQYWEAAYWDRRYKSEDGLSKFEWYHSYDTLEPMLKAHLEPTGQLLHVSWAASKQVNSLPCLAIPCVQSAPADVAV